MTYGIFNITKNKWLLDENFQVVVCDSIFKSERELRDINEIKTLSRRTEHYEYEIREDPDLSESFDMNKYEPRS